MAIKLLHLSDIHWCDKPDCLDTYKVIRETFLNDIKDYCDENGKIDFILICGDIAFSGKKEEYRRAEGFIDKLCGKTGCAKENVMLVPGNHDKDRNAKPVAIRKLIHAGLATHKDRDDLMYHYFSKCSSHVPLLYEPFRSYCDFSRQHLSAEPIMQRSLEAEPNRYSYNEDVDKLYWHTKIADLNGFEIIVYGFNTALICDEHDYNPPKVTSYYHKMILPRLAYQVPMENPKEIRIMMCHHPLDYIVNGEEIEKTLDKHFHIQFYGHVHSFDPVLKDNSLTIRSGAFQPDGEPTDKYRPTYNVVDIDCVPQDDTISILKVSLDVQAWDIDSETFTENYKHDFEIHLKTPVNRFAKGKQKQPIEKNDPLVSKRQVRIELTKRANLKAIVTHFDKLLWIEGAVRYDNESAFLKWIDQNNKWNELWNHLQKN